VTDSWESFAASLQAESIALGAVKDIAMRLQQALVENEAETISRVERELDQARKEFMTASGKRRGMQVRGFGQMTLRQVCAYAPRSLAPAMNQRLYELVNASINIKLTNSNNKALIASGISRLIKITAALQKASSDQPGTYRRRGFIPPPNNSVLVSSKA
jgi:hypothetical protein